MMNDPQEEDPFREYPDITSALEEAPARGEHPVPEHVLFALERSRQEALETRRNESAAPIRRARPIAVLAGLAASFALLVTVVVLYLPGDDDPSGVATARVTVTSPGDRIADTRPTIAWTSKDEPGQRYDVWILPESGDHLEVPALFVAKGVMSPVWFDALEPGPGATETLDPGALEPDTGYRVLVCLADAGRLAGVPVPFRIETSP